MIAETIFEDFVELFEDRIAAFMENISKVSDIHVVCKTDGGYRAEESLAALGVRSYLVLAQGEKVLRKTLALEMGGRLCPTNSAAAEASACQRGLLSHRMLLGAILHHLS